MEAPKQGKATLEPVSIDMVGPITIQIKIFVTDGKAVAIGKAPIGLITHSPVGQIPSAEEIARTVDQWVRYQMPAGFRLMTKKEFWDYQCLTNAGAIYPLGGNPEFEREWGKTDYEFSDGTEPPRLAPPARQKNLSPAQRVMRHQRLSRVGNSNKKH